MKNVKRLALSFTISCALLLATASVFAGVAGAAPKGPPPPAPQCSAYHTIASSGYIGYSYYNVQARIEQQYTPGGGNCTQWRPVIDIYPFATHTFAFVCERFTSNGSNSYDSACLYNVALTGGHTWSFAAPWWKPSADFHCQGPYAAKTSADDFAGGSDTATSPYECMP